MDLRINVNGDAVIRALQNKAKMVRLAARAAMNDTAFQVRTAIGVQMDKDFQGGATPWLKSQIWVTKADKTNLIASVAPDEWGGSIPILRAQVFGGTRPPKKGESQMRDTGKMERGQYYYPAIGAPLDKYGNIPGSRMVRILSSVQAFRETGYKMNIAKAGASPYFIMRDAAGTPEGIYMRLKGNEFPMPILIFGKQPHYKKRLRYFESARDCIKKNLGPNLAIRIKQYSQYQE